MQPLVTSILLRSGSPLHFLRVPSGILQTDGKRPDGMTLVPWSSGKPLTWDVKVIWWLLRTFANIHTHTNFISPETRVPVARLLFCLCSVYCYCYFSFSSFYPLLHINSIYSIHKSKVSVVCWWTDIDECAGSIGWSCTRKGRGTCDGYNPAGHYTCNCKPGYNTTFSESECIGNTALYTVDRLAVK